MRRAHLSEQQNGYGGQQTHLIEDENERLEGELADKVNALRTLSINIGEEVRSQNAFINSVDDDFEGAGGFLRKTMGRVTQMANAGHNCYIIYLLAFCLFVFFICWLIIKTR